MKCKTCKKRMKSVITSLSIVVDNRKVEIVNVPVEQCPACGAIWISDVVKENAKRYAVTSKCLTVDYTKREDEENANFVTTQMLLW
jgi:YgiT-type zinc finger domain-containing protein